MAIILVRDVNESRQQAHTAAKSIFGNNLVIDQCKNCAKIMQPDYGTLFPTLYAKLDVANRVVSFDPYDEITMRNDHSDV